MRRPRPGPNSPGAACSPAPPRCPGWPPGRRCCPPSLSRALAATLADPPGGSLRDIEHIVIAMQENRSFDHYFGTMPGVRGFADPAAIRLPGGGPVFRQPDPGHAAGLPGPVPPRHQDYQRAGHARHRPLLADPAPGLEQRCDGPVGTGQGAVHDGVLHAGGHPIPVGAGPGLHGLRPLLLLGARPDQPEPALHVDRDHRPGRYRRRPRHRQQPRPRQRHAVLDHLPGAAAAGRGQLAGVPGGGQLRRQRAGLVQAVRQRSGRFTAVAAGNAEGHGGLVRDGCQGGPAAAGVLAGRAHRAVRAPVLLPGRWRGVHRQQAGRDRVQRGPVAQDPVHPDLRRERRAVRPRAAAGRAPRDAGRVRGR